MADDFFGQRYHTQRVNQDITKDIEALETPIGGDDEKREVDPFASSPEADDNNIANNPFARKKTMGDEDGSAGGCTMDDLLNGYIINNELLSAIDECLIYISQEWDLSDILSKDLTDVERLISTKCAKAANNLTSTIIDPPRVIYDTLLRLARKVMAVNLVVNNQKMIYVPVKSYMNIYKYPGTHI